MKPLKAELDALREVLMTPLEEFLTVKEWERADAETLAQTRMFTKAIEAVDAARGARTMHAVVMEFGTTSFSFLAYGPYATAKQAHKAREKAVATFAPRHAVVVPYRSPEGLPGLIAELDEVPEKREQSKEAERAAVKKINGLIHENQQHLRANAKGIKPIGNVRDLRRREGLDT